MPSLADISEKHSQPWWKVRSTDQEGESASNFEQKMINSSRKCMNLFLASFYSVVQSSTALGVHVVEPYLAQDTGVSGPCPCPTQCVTAIESITFRRAYP